MIMKKVSLRKIAALAASMAMFAMTLAGCGSTASDSGSSSDGTTSAAAASGDDTVKVGLLHSLTGSMKRTVLPNLRPSQQRLKSL